MGTSLDISCSGYAKMGRVSTMVRTVVLWPIDSGTNPAKSTTLDLLKLSSSQPLYPDFWRPVPCTHMGQAMLRQLGYPHSL